MDSIPPIFILNAEKCELLINFTVTCIPSHDTLCKILLANS
jgi:hypothetical protein